MVLQKFGSVPPGISGHALCHISDPQSRFFCPFLRDAWGPVHHLSKNNKVNTKLRNTAV